MSASTRSAGVLSVFFISGATSLVYQVIWTRWLGLVFGNTTSSISIVLGAFMCGLALGSAAAGRWMDRVDRPLRAYAACEAGIGAFAVVLPLLLRLIEVVHTSVDDGGGNAPVVVLSRALLSFLVVCLPTGLMGATLPLLAEHFRRHPHAGHSWRVGVLYAANTIGAAFGIVTAGFVLIELLGVTVTTGLAALGNLLVAAVAWRLDGRSGPSVAAVARSGGSSKDLAWVAIALAVTGALALASEVLWTRVLSSFLGTSTYAFTTIVCTYLVGIAIGSWAMSRLIPRLADIRGAFLLVVLVAGCAHMVSVELFLVMATTWDLERGIPVPIPRILGFYLQFALLLLPLAMASGACFPLATRIINDEDPDAEGSLVARAYAANTWGSVVGSLTAGFIIAAWLDFEPSLRLIGVAYFGAVIVAAVWLRGRSPRALLLGTVAAGAIGAVAIRHTTRPSFEERFASARPERLVMHRPGVQGVTSILETAGPEQRRILLVNHHGMTVKIADTKLMAHLPLFLHDAPGETLIICFGMGTTFRSALSHGGNATVVEIVPAVADSFEYFYADAGAVRANPRGRIVVGDGRHFLSATEKRFDVITLDPPPPIDGEGVNHLYSRDFAELARSRLKPGGIMAHWIPLPGTGSGVDDMETIDMLVDSFASAFEYTTVVVALNNVGLHVLGSDHPLDLGAEGIAARMAARPAAVTDLNEFGEVPPEFLSSGHPLGRERTSSLLVTDDHPLLEFYLVRGLLRHHPKVLTGHMWIP